LNSSEGVRSQCDQIGWNFAIWASLGYFLLNQFSPKQAASKHSFALGILRFQIWFDVVDFDCQIKLRCSLFLLEPFFPKLGEILINVLVTLTVTIQSLKLNFKNRNSCNLKIKDKYDLTVMRVI
jgi:hypothetical protein